MNRPPKRRWKTGNITLNYIVEQIDNHKPKMHYDISTGPGNLSETRYGLDLMILILKDALRRVETLRQNTPDTD